MPPASALRIFIELAVGWKVEQGGSCGSVPSRVMSRYSAVRLFVVGVVCGFPATERDTKRACVYSPVIREDVTNGIETI